MLASNKCHITLLMQQYSGFSNEEMNQSFYKIKHTNCMKTQLTKLLSIVLLSLLFMGKAHSQTLIFSQDFNTGADSVNLNVYGIITNTNFVDSVSPTSSKFTCISAGKQSSSKLTVNSGATGELQAISAGTGFNWAVTRNVNMATAPTAIKVIFRAKFDVGGTGSGAKFYFMAGNGFTNEKNGYSAVPSLPTSAVVNSGFSMSYNNSTNGPILYLFDGTTQMNGATNITEAYLNYTMVINKSASSLIYTDTTGASRTLNANCYDLWLGTTRVGSNIAATNSANNINQFKFGDFSTAGRANVYFDYVRVYDITPAACTTPGITNPSGATQSMCAGANGPALSVTGSGSGTIYYQWYKNLSNNNTSGTAISGATSNSYTPNESSAGTYYYYCKDSTGSGCVATSNQSGAYTVNAAPVPTFSSAPSGTVSINTAQTYTTQSGQSNYVWTFSGTGGVDYNLTGGTSSDNSSTVTWLTAGSKTVTVNYSSSGCSGASAASNTITVSASVFYNAPNSDVTQTGNWSTNTGGTGGTQPLNFTDAGQTFNLFNTGASLSGDWTVSGAGSKVVVGDGSNPVTFNASTIVSATIDVSNNGTLLLTNSSVPTFGTLASGSTVEYGGSSITQAVTATSYSNLTLSGSGTRSFSGTTNISNAFTPGTGFSASAGTIVLNGTSAAQVIPAFAYNSLTVSGVDGKSTSGALTVAGTLTMSNSFTVATGSSIATPAATMTSTAAKTLTVNGTFETSTNTAAFNAGSGSMTVAAGGTFKFSGTGIANSTNITFTNVNLTSGIGAAGSTLYVGTGGLPRINSATINGNVTIDCNVSNGTAILLNVSSVTITGNLNIVATNGIISHATGGSARSLSVSGNLTMTGGRYDISAGASSGACALTVAGNVTLSGANDTLYTASTSNSGGAGTINIQGGLSHTAGVLGRSSSTTAAGTIAFTGSAMQDISTIGITSNTNITLNNTNGARLLSDLSVGSTLTLTSGKLRTNGNSVILTGTSSTISGASFGAAATSFIATVDGSGTPVSSGGLTIQNIGTGGRTTAVAFPIGTSTSYNPASVTNTGSAVAFTARVNTTAFPGTTSDSTVARTWNIQPASGSPSAVIGLQWNSSEEGANFARNSASLAHWTGSVVDVYSSGGAASGSNPYYLTSGATAFTGFGDFGLIKGIVIPATEPTVQASGASVVAGTTSATINWTKSSDATNSLVLIKQASAVNGTPSDGTSYSDGSAVFGSGTQIGSGNYVVYNGTGNSVIVTGLTSGVTYHVAVYAFNGSSGTENVLTTSPATANGTTGVPTYYYVGGAGNSSNTFATANMWATTLNGTPLAGFTPGNSDVFIFDATNLGGGYTDSVTIAPISSATTLGKLILQNNAKVNIIAGGTRTMSIGNSGYTSNTTVISVPVGSKLYISGSQNTISLAANSSANISGSFYLGNGSGNSTLVPNATGSFITVNSGAYVEANLSSSSTNPFGASGSNLVTFASGSTYKHTKGSDVFGGTGVSVASFASGSTFWYANTSNSTAQTLSGRTFGNVIVEANWNPTAGSTGFTMENISMPTTGFTFTMNETGTNNHLKGNITIANGATFKFNAASAATYYFDGTSAQTITNSGTWNLATGLSQSLVVSNSAGLSIAGANGITLSSVAGTSMTVNSGSSLTLSAGTLNINGGTLNLNGTLSRTSGTINASNTGATVNVTGVSSLPSGLFTSNTIRNLVINRSAGVSIGSDITISTALTLTDGIVDMGSNTMIMSASTTVNRTSGWINGSLRKNVGSGFGIVRAYEIGDAVNYTPVSLNFDTVTTAGDLTCKTVANATAYPAYSTSPISNNNYVNRYWDFTNVNSLVFKKYTATFNYVSGDKVGSFTESDAIAARYTGSSWTSHATTTGGSNSNSASGIAAIGDFIIAQACTTVTPSVTISTASDTVCSGSVTTFTATGINPGPGPIYTWKQNGISVGSGSSISFAAGTLSMGDIISCTLTANNNCQTTATANSNAYTMYVKESPAVGTSSVVKSLLCAIGSTTVAQNSNTLGGGVWSSSNESVVTVTTENGSGGTVTAVGNGTAVLTYSKEGNGCTSTANVNITVAQVTTPNSITGTNSICKGSTTQLATTSNGGSWSSQNNYASVNGTGLVTGLYAGTAVIRYTVTNGSGCNAYASYNVTVNPIPNTPSIGYASGSVNPQVGSGGTSNFCNGKTFTVVGSPGGGVWGSSNTGRLTVTTPGGVCQTIGLGAVSLTYTYTSPAGCVSSKTISGTVVTCASRGVNTNVLATNDSKFTLYPNPATSFINLNVHSLVGSGSIVITDLYGKQVKQQPLSMGSNAVDVSRLAKGMYMVNIITSDGKKTEKLIVE